MYSYGKGRHGSLHKINLSIGFMNGKAIIVYRYFSLNPWKLSWSHPLNRAPGDDLIS